MVSRSQGLVHPRGNLRSRNHNLSRSNIVSDILVEQINRWAVVDFFRSYHLHDKVTLCPSSGAGPLLYHGFKIGYDRYDLSVTHWSSQICIEIHVRLNNECEIEVYHGRKWGSAICIMSAIDLPSFPAEYEGRVNPNFWGNERWNWWQLLEKTGKKFRFMDLPLEVREVVYSFAIHSVMVPYPRNRAHRSHPLTQHCIRENQVNRSLRRANQRIYAETGSFIFRHATFQVKERPILKRILEDSFLMSRLTKLRLELYKHDTYLKLFGLFVNWDKVFEPASAAKALRFLKLKDLVLGIPSHLYLCENPRYDVCQKGFVDLILDAAFRWVKGQPVRVVGFIKPEQKQEFESRCRDQRKMYLQWCEQKSECYEDGTPWEWDEYMTLGGGVRIESPEVRCGREHEDEALPTILMDQRFLLPASIEEGERTAREFPPICQCKEVCSVSSWEPLD